MLFGVARNRKAFSIDAYSSPISVVSGARISFHVAAWSGEENYISRDQACIKVYGFLQLRYGGASDLPFKGRTDRLYTHDYRCFLTVEPEGQPHFVERFPIKRQNTVPNAAVQGCGWDAAVGWTLPRNARHGLYIAQITCEGSTTYVLFVVRPAQPGSTGRILCQLSWNTYQAYNGWGGSCFYKLPIGSGRAESTAVQTVSMERPCQLLDFMVYEEPIFSWLERHYDVEYCTNLDLHTNKDLLTVQNYKLFISCGHDEYWSSEMRDHVEGFSAAGGNVMFLSGNTCHRGVRISDGKISKINNEGFWERQSPPRYPAETTGVNWSAGQWSKKIARRGYRAERPSHWAFAGTGLQRHEIFGDKEGIIGYETDAAGYVRDDQGYPVPTRHNGTPPTLSLLATADLPNWRDRPGMATMGMFERGAGIVMTAGTTGWGQGLKQSRGHVHQITMNVVDRLGLGKR
jgi:hypothetical protein